MDLEFAKKRLLKVHEENEVLAIHNRNKKELAKEFLTDNEAIEAVIAELHAMQNLLDEKREELDHLQKENEELLKETRKKIIIAPGRRGLTKTYEYGLLVGTKREREHWQNKIRKEIESLEKQEKTEFEPKGVVVLPKDTAYLAVKTEYYHKKNVLQDLLKEE